LLALSRTAFTGAMQVTALLAALIVATACVLAVRILHQPGGARPRIP